MTIAIILVACALFGIAFLALGELPMSVKLAVVAMGSLPMVVALLS